MSAERIYDKFKKKAKGKILYKTSNSIVCRFIKK